jgi:hypothetical protein
MTFLVCFFCVDRDGDTDMVFLGAEERRQGGKEEGAANVGQGVPYRTVAKIVILRMFVPEDLTVSAECWNSQVLLPVRSIVVTPRDGSLCPRC